MMMLPMDILSIKIRLSVGFVLTLAMGTLVEIGLIIGKILIPSIITLIIFTGLVFYETTNLFQVEKKGKMNQ